MLVALVALPAKAQTFGMQNKGQVEMPSAAFQSTSAMTPVGSAYSANPMLNADGTAYSPSQTASPARIGAGPRKIGPSANETPDPTDKVPLGEPIIPLLLTVMVYAAYIFLRRRKSRV